VEELKFVLQLRAFGFLPKSRMAHRRLKAILIFGLLLTGFGNPAQALTPDQLAVVVNADLPLSVQMGEYYLKARRLPPENLIRVHVPAAGAEIGAAEFQQLKQDIDGRLSSSIQAVLFAWTTPYRVSCMSFTSAYTLGFDATLCRNTCAPTRPSPYFNTASRQPWEHYDMRPSMLLGALNFADAKALIDRGRAADGSNPPNAAAYLLITSDKRRSSRAMMFPRSGKISRPALKIHTLRANYIERKSGILFYLTGRVSVPKLETLGFLPGALADHLTSTGGDLLGHTQMSSLRWLEAGATASYGTVSEPCSHPQKFPNAGVLIKHYLQGETALESYWKSVEWPSQGIFIGEPLAAPYRPDRVP
jgi:uncharacterized protein (TIGR03790 family)